MIRPQPGKIPVRFHLYWAGSDRDGSVAGYYFAVVETLAVPQEGTSSVPGLPGPKARDYQFTTQSDSIFVFTASEEVSERQHAFFVYAVDNKGRADATPARFIFSAYDRFPPLAIVDELRADGVEYELLPGGGVRSVNRTYFVRDSFEVSNTHSFPRDTVSANALLTIKWHGEPTIPSTVVTGYRYKLDETSFNSVDSSVRQVTYNTGVGADKVIPGPKIFTLRAIGQSGWRGETTRWFQMNFAPDTWFAGPDPNDPLAGWQTALLAGKRYWWLDQTLTGWPGTIGSTFPGVPGTMMSDDSLAVLPALRQPRKTFFEIYNDRLWLRAEDDTVHMNSWVIIPAGGFDRDSPYRVRVNVPLVSDTIRNSPVGTPGGPNGSPIGFRIKVQVRDAAGGVTQPSETTTYPVYDPASVFNEQKISGYWGMVAAGRAYAVIRAEDGDGTVDRRVDQRPGEAVGIVQRVEGGTTDPQDLALRSKILTFYVDRVPALTRSNPAFRPRNNEALLRRGNTFNLPATDVDPLDFGGAFTNVGGTPRTGGILRRKIAIIGKKTGDATKTVCYVVPGDFPGTGSTVQVPNVDVPDSIAAGTVTVRIRLCDCIDCDVTPPTSDCEAFKSNEANASHGRCVDTNINCTVGAPLTTVPDGPAGASGAVGGSPAGQAPATTSDRSTRENPRPGSTPESGRRMR